MSAQIATIGIPPLHVPYCDDCSWRGRETRDLDDAWSQCDAHDDSEEAGIELAYINRPASVNEGPSDA